MSGEMVHGPVGELLRRKHPSFGPQDVICLPCLTHLRAEYVEDALEDEKGELSSLEQAVVRSLKEQELLTENLNVEFDRQLTLGERTADRVAEFGGSWRFIIIFAAVLVVWIALNSVVLLWRPFDPYPFILLNLVLSSLAALQAPIIMMSQNRQAAKDRLRAGHDYRVDLKAELEIRHLHWKLDQLLTHQWRRLLEIQQIQTELIEELARRPRERPPSASGPP
ncbi:MAG: DUF1003 domain-containing protein [Candidatus Rokubacteria bacterium]|nr:DUF1003 domain-containing protein [Candidatus Rokubacteria bacterium]